MPERTCRDVARDILWAIRRWQEGLEAKDYVEVRAAIDEVQSL